MTPKTQQQLPSESSDKEKRLKRKERRLEKMALLEEDPPKLRCRHCKTIRTLDHFVYDHRISCGRMAVCFLCYRSKRKGAHKKNVEGYRIRQRRAYSSEKSRAAYLKMISDPIKRRRALDKNKELRKKYPEKHKARTLLQKAVRRGKIIKPSQCSACNKHNCKIEGHHHDYSQPLNVTWLCPQCHRREHLGIDKMLDFKTAYARKQP